MIYPFYVFYFYFCLHHLMMLNHRWLFFLLKLISIFLLNLLIPWIYFSFYRIKQKIHYKIKLFLLFDQLNNDFGQSLSKLNSAFIKRTLKNGQNFCQKTWSAKIKIAYLCSAHRNLSEYTKILTIFGGQNELIISSKSFFSVFWYNKIPLFYFYHKSEIISYVLELNKAILKISAVKMNEIKIIFFKKALNFSWIYFTS